jgi:hypothetical protein
MAITSSILFIVMKAVVYPLEELSLNRTQSPLIELPLLSTVDGFLLNLRIAEADLMRLTPASLLSLEVFGAKERMSMSIRFLTILQTMSGIISVLRILASTGIFLTLMKPNTITSKLLTSTQEMEMKINLNLSLLLQLLTMSSKITTDGKSTRTPTS